MLRRFIRRCVYGSCLVEVCIGRLQIVFLRNGFRVAEPVADDVNRETGSEIGLSGCPQIVEKFRPRLNSRPIDHFSKLLPQVHPPPETPFRRLSGTTRS